MYATVRRWYGPAAGLIAAGAAALTPVAALMFRYDNPDALLVLLMTAAAYATARAIESGRTRWLVLTGGLLGFAFLTKMLQGFLVVPAFALAYLVAGPPRLGRRLWQLLAGAAALVVGAGWWVAIVELTPAADRPYIGGSTANNVLQLALGYNGLGRLDGNETGSVGFRGGTGPRFTGSAGLTRLFAADMGGQVSWLLPAALIALAAMTWLSWRAARTDRLRAAALLWGGWLLVTGGVFSFMAGIIHPYYTVALVPAIGALTGIGAVLLWRERDRLWARLTLAGAIVVTAAWGYVLLDRAAGWLPWLRTVVVVAGALAAALVLAAPALARRAGPVPLPGRARGGGAGRPGRPARADLRAGRAGRLQHRHRRDRPHRCPPGGRPGRGLVRRPRRWRPGRDRSRRRANTGGWHRPRRDGHRGRAPRPVPRRHGAGRRPPAEPERRALPGPEARRAGPAAWAATPRWRPP